MYITAFDDFGRQVIGRNQGSAAHDAHTALDVTPPAGLWTRWTAAALGGVCLSMLLAGTGFQSLRADN